MHGRCLEPPVSPPDTEWTRPDGKTFTVGQKVLYCRGTKVIRPARITRMQTRGLGPNYERVWITFDGYDEQEVVFPSIQPLEVTS